MDIESVRKFCLSLPHTDEKVQWGNDLLFRIGEKMFAVAALEPGHGVALSFKCTPEKFAELVERQGIIPAPYMARHHWVGLERFDALPDRELKPLLTNAYQMVLEKLPRKVRTALEGTTAKDTKPAKQAKRR
jgi:predicted DNA-binding protein (MmcQ/YjbR family)